MLVLILLLLVIMPALLYLVCWGVMRYTKKTPSRVGFPTPRDDRSDKVGGEPPVRVGE
jgi:hypothetical protein